MSKHWSNGQWHLSVFQGPWPRGDHAWLSWASIRYHRVSTAQHHRQLQT